MNSTYIIAEVGNTHEGSLGLAKQFIKTAAECGANAIKFQTHIFEAESCENAPNPPYFCGETRKEYFTRTAFTRNQYIELKKYAESECGVDFLSSPFSLEAVDLLEDIAVSAYKIPSGEVSNIPLLKKIALTGKKVYLSSGMSSWQEIDLAVSTLKKNGCSDLLLMQCTSEYPCPSEHSGLNVMVEMKNRYHLPVGYSDHTLSIAVPVCAVVMGATVIEKHFTLSKNMYGSDAGNSFEPEEFKFLVNEIRAAEKAVYSMVDKDISGKKLGEMKYVFEKSIVAAGNLDQGDIIKESDLAFKKPGNGIAAREYEKIVGKKLKVIIRKDEQFKWEYLE